MASSNGGTSSYNSPCAACKFLRRKCMPGCIFAPYFPPEEPQKFANVHKIFGASNVTKLLNELLPHQREDAVNSLAYEAEARVRDPVYGCVGAISFLQRQVDRLQKELDAANAVLIRYGGYVAAAATCCNAVVSDSFNNLVSHRQSSANNRPVPALDHLNQLMNNNYNTTRNLIIHQAAGASLGGGGGGSLYQTTPSSTNFPFPLPWTSTSFDNLSTELEDRDDTNIGGAAGGT